MERLEEWQLYDGRSTLDAKILVCYGRQCLSGFSG